MINTTRIDSIKGNFPLYLRYDRQHQPQRAFIAIDEHGAISAGTNCDVGNAVPMDVWHNRTLRFAVPSRIGARQLRDFIARMRPLFERVHAGHTVEWDGNNMVGRLTVDAEDAIDQIECSAEALG